MAKRSKMASSHTMEQLEAVFMPRRELEARLEKLATKQDLERFATKQDLERFATKEDLALCSTKEDLALCSTKQDLETWAGALLAKMQTMFTEMRNDIRTEMRSMRIELETDLVRHTKAMTEDLRTETRAVDERYADLPGRVSQLERDR